MNPILFIVIIVYRKQNNLIVIVQIVMWLEIFTKNLNAIRFLIKNKVLQNLKIKSIIKKELVIIPIICLMINNNNNF